MKLKIDKAQLEMEIAEIELKSYDAIDSDDEREEDYENALEDYVEDNCD